MTQQQRALLLQLEQQLGTQPEQISHYIFTHAELGLREYQSAAYLADYMEKQGFAVTRGICGLETAFSAVWGESGPCIAFLSEYDALAGYGPENKDPGHACGHNWIAGTTAGAAVTLANLCKAEGLAARVLLVGCPAEETFSAKAILAQHGIFDGVDCALQAHLGDVNIAYPWSLALGTRQLIYTGKAAHAAAAPWNGINALDAVRLFFNGIDALRQQVRPDVRIHGVIQEGGQAANSIPERASCLFYIRSARWAELQMLLQRVEDIARGAALMTGAQLEIRYPEQPMQDLLPVPTLQELAAAWMASEGMESLSRQQCRDRSRGSTDVGNVSYVCPTQYLEIDPACGKPFLGHTQAALELADEPSYPALHRAIRVLAGMGAELILDADLRRRCHAEWAKAVESGYNP